MNALEMAYYIVSTTYTDEFCAVCGSAIKVDVPKTSVWKEINGNRALRPAHQDCAMVQMPENFPVNHH
jgi:hypothetical protein